MKSMQDTRALKLFFTLPILAVLLSGCFGSYSCENFDSLDATTQTTILQFYPDLNSCSNSATGIVVDGVTINGIVVDGAPVSGD